MKIDLLTIMFFCVNNVEKFNLDAGNIDAIYEKTKVICDNYFNSDKTEEEMEFCNFSCINSLDEEYNKLKLILLNEENKISRIYMLEKLDRLQFGVPIGIGFDLQFVFIFLKLMTNNDQKKIAYILNEFSNQ
jgi:hypothetical protein